MPEKLLTRKEAAERLHMHPVTFSRCKAKLLALGLQPVRIGGFDKFREASLDGLIKRLAENGGR